MSNYYETLQIPMGSSPEEIKKAFRKLAMIHHPDRGGDVEMFKKINTAYHELIRDFDNHKGNNAFSRWSNTYEATSANVKRIMYISELRKKLQILKMKRNDIDRQIGEVSLLIAQLRS